MDIVFVISHFPDPRMNKRIQLASTIGKVAVIFWDRKTVDIWDITQSKVDNIKIEVKADYTNPLKRIIPTVKFACRALKELKRLNPKCLYVSNIDMLMIATCYSYIKTLKPKIIYEIADLNKLIIDEQIGSVKKLIKKILITLEKKICKKISVLVVTSEKFFDVYYSQFVPKHKMIFVPNMPNTDVFNGYVRKTDGKFTVGFIGAVRYKEQMKMLVKVSEACNVNVLFAGTGLDDEIKEFCKDKPNIYYYGKYNYDSEIANLYGKVDCVYAVYDADLTNVRIALPNKLYESIYCELPIIVAKGTYLSELVEEIGVGVAVSHIDSNELSDTLLRLSTDDFYYESFVKKCKTYKNKINLKYYNEQMKDIMIKALTK